MSKKLLAILAVVILLVIWGYSIMQEPKSENDQSNQNSETIQNDQTTTDTVDSDMQTGQDLAEVDSGTSSPGRYVEYAEANLTNETNIIFFAATWCPSCRGLDNDIKNNLSDIPSNMTILKVDYDSSQDLKVKYGVTIQHTLVQVDKNGNLINKWNGLYQITTLNDIIEL